MRTVLVVLLTVWCSNLVCAQSIVPDDHGCKYLLDVLPPVSQPKVSDEANEELISNLKGIRLFAVEKDLRPEGVEVEGIDQTNLLKKAPDRVIAVLKAHLGKPVTLNSLDKLVKDCVIAYRESDIAVIDILLPEQDITPGAVQLHIVFRKQGVVKHSK